MVKLSDPGLKKTTSHSGMSPNKNIKIIPSILPEISPEIVSRKE